MLAGQQPVISVDTPKKKRNWLATLRMADGRGSPAGDPEEVRVRRFSIKEQGRAVPYGVYAIWPQMKAGSPSGIDHDVAAQRGADDPQLVAQCWSPTIPRRPLSAMITADGGGSNGSRVRLWKPQLQKLADELGIEITVHHLLPWRHQLE